MRTRGGWKWVGAMLISAAGCGSENDPSRVVVVPPVVVSRVEIALPPNPLFNGDTLRAAAIVIGVSGDTIRGRTATWAVAPAGIATVSSTGLLTGVSLGFFTLTATVDGVVGSTAVEVQDAERVTSIALGVETPFMVAGDTLQIIAESLNARNQVVPGKTIAWVIDGSPGAATISNTGLLTAISPGIAQVTASVDGVIATRRLTVTQPEQVYTVGVDLPAISIVVGDTVQATAVTLNARGEVLSGKSVTWSIVAPAGIATVSSNGLVTAVGPGSATVKATVDGVSGQSTIAVTAVPVSTVSSPRLPAVLLDFPYPSLRRQQIVVNAGDNLQTALNRAQRGDEVVLKAGATFTGNFTLPTKLGTVSDGWIVVRTEQLAALPPSGTRVTPSVASLMPRIVTPNADAALATTAGATGWRIVGVEITVDGAFAGQHNGIVLLGDGSSVQHLATQVPSDLVLDRVYIHGQTTTNGKRCVALNSARTAIVDSYLHECHGRGFDSQAIAGWNGPGPYKIVNNTLAGAGENIIFGGADPAIASLIPSDIEIRGNYIVTPASWKNVWTKKNLLETKNVQRVLIEGNVLDGSWGDGQNGVGLNIKSTNQSGRCTWCASRDVTVRYNLIRNVAQSVTLAGTENAARPVGERLARVLIENNVFEGLNVAPYNGDARLILVLQNVANLVIRRNTWDANPADILTFLTFGNTPAATNLVFEGNVVPLGRYGLIGDTSGEGVRALGNARGVVRFEANAVYGGTRQGYPAGTSFFPTLVQALGLPGAGADRSQLESRIGGVLRQ